MESQKSDVTEQLSPSLSFTFNYALTYTIVKNSIDFQNHFRGKLDYTQTFPKMAQYPLKSNTEPLRPESQALVCHRQILAATEYHSLDNIFTHLLK